MFIIYGKIKCAYCDKAVSLLRSSGCDFEYHSMDHRPEELEYLSTIYNWKTVPLIIEKVNGQEFFVGGYDDLIKRMQVKTSEKND